MSAYHYSPLTQDSIRLLRLQPHQDKHSPIQCQLLDFPLLDSEGPYPYEALSYVWGSGDKPHSISVDNCSLPIGANLYAALTHLRHGCFERIIWVDAICINQEDIDEKGVQVQLMAKIYAKAYSVIVWLGEAAAESEQALEEIRVAATNNEVRRAISFSSLARSTRHSTNNSNESQVNKSISESIIALLRRPWFQRIWVLQEVAAARQIMIKCGFAEINGYAFCAGLSALKLSYNADPSLEALIRSVSHLIRGAIFRPRRMVEKQGRFSLDICPLSELVEMYHTRKATERHDKIYALLGMSSDDPESAGLSADYQLPWQQLFQKLVKYILPQCSSVRTWENKEMAMIKAMGCVLGKIDEVQKDSTWGDSQKVHLKWKIPNIETHQASFWTFKSSAKSVKVGDIVCLLRGSSRPTIIRPRRFYWEVIIISVPPEDLCLSYKYPKWNDNVLQLLKTSSIDFELIWDWDMRSVEPNASQEEACASLMNKERQTLPGIEHRLFKISKFGNIGLILFDMSDERAESYHREAMGDLESVLRALDADSTNGHDMRTKSGKELEAIIDIFIGVWGGWLPLRLAVIDGHNLVAKLLFAKANLKVKVYGNTPLTWAVETDQVEIVKMLLNTGSADPDEQDEFGRTPLIWAARYGKSAIVKLLLETANIDPNIKEGPEAIKGGRRTPLLCASQHGHVEVVKLLLANDEVDINIRDTLGGAPWEWALIKGHNRIADLMVDKLDRISKMSLYWGVEKLRRQTKRPYYKAYW